MKAQSELTGDRKRRAETARPRFGGATTWMDGRNDDSESVTCDMEVVKRLLLAAITRDISGGVTTSRETPTGVVIETTYPEVNPSPCRPATGGMYSVNSANPCRRSVLLHRVAFLF